MQWSLFPAKIFIMDEISKRITEIEKEMSKPDFWKDKDNAQALVKELNNLKEQQKGGASGRG